MPPDTFGCWDRPHTEATNAKRHSRGCAVTQTVPVSAEVGHRQPQATEPHTVGNRIPGLELYAVSMERAFRTNQPRPRLCTLGS